MSGEKLLDTRNITRDVKKYLKNYAKAYATIASEDLTSAAQSFVNKFYDDYTPKIYDRTNNFQRNSYRKIYEANSSGLEFTGGVILTWEKMSPYVKSWNGIKELITIEPWVVWDDAMNGYHGPAGSNHLPKVMSPSPRGLMNEYFKKNGTLNNKKYTAYAKKYADSQRYLTFGF